MGAIVRCMLLIAIVVAQQARTASGGTPGYTRAPESDDSQPLYIPPDVSCAELRAFARDTASDGSTWFESGPLHCEVTYHGTAESSTQGRTSVSFNTTYRVHKELLSHVLNAVRRAKERDTRQVGDPFIAPYLAGIYQRLGLEYSSLLCFPRVTLLWRHLSAGPWTHEPEPEPVTPHTSAHTTARSANPTPSSCQGSSSGVGSPSGEEEGQRCIDGVEVEGQGQEQVPHLHGGGGSGSTTSANAWAAATAARLCEAAGACGAGPALYAAAGRGRLQGQEGPLPGDVEREEQDAEQVRRLQEEDDAGHAWRPGQERERGRGGQRRAMGGVRLVRGVPLDWHVQQLHRELVLEPWKPAELRLLLGRAAAYSEALAAGGSGTCAPLSLGPLLPRQLQHGPLCSYPPPGAARPPEPGSVMYWALWGAAPTVLVALDALQGAPDNPWLALYICVIATCRTLAEWRAMLAALAAPRLTVVQRLYGLGLAHLGSAAASVLVTGLLNTWLPLLGHGAAAALVWLHLLLLPAVMVAGMCVSWMPLVARQVAAAAAPYAWEVGSTADSWDGGVQGGGADGIGGLEGGGRGTTGGRTLRAGALGRNTANGSGPNGLGIAARSRGGASGGGGRVGGRPGSAAAAAAAAAAEVHWPPALDVPQWLDDWPNAPEAFRCPITQSIMREPAQASSGVTYERPAILQWLEHRRVDPVTHVALKRHRLAPNLNLRHMIEVWVQDRVDARQRLAQRVRAEAATHAAAAAAAKVAKTALSDSEEEEGEEGDSRGDLDTHRSDVGVRDENEEEQEGEQEGEVAGEDKQPGGGSTSGEAGSRADGDGVHFATENAVSAAVRQWDREDLGGHQAAGKGRGGPAEQQSAPSGAHDAGEDQDGGQAAVSLPSAPAPSGVTGPHAVAGVGVAGAGRATPGVRAMDSSGHDGVDVGAGREGEGETGMRPRGAAGAGRGQGGGHVERWIEVQAEVGEGDGDGDGDVEGSGVGRGAAVDEVGLAEEVEVMAEAVARARAAEELRRRVSRRRMGGELGVGEELLDSVDVEAEDAEGGSESNGSASESGSGVEGISEGGAGEDGEDGDVDVAGESAEGTGRDSNE